MPLFLYRAKTKDGSIQEGKMEAENRFLLARRLREGGSTVLSAKELTEKKEKKFLTTVLSFFNQVRLKEKIMFTNNMSTMIAAGLSLSRSLEIIGRQTKNQKLKSVVDGLLAGVASGKSFSDGLAGFPDVFPPFFVAMVRSGEESGRLPETLLGIRDQLSKTYELKRKIRSAMIYPAIVISLIIVIAILMMIFVVPTLSATFKELGGELPITTRFILGLSDFIRAYIIFIIFFVIAVCTFWVSLVRKTTMGKHAISWFLLHAPITRSITQETNSALTMRTLASLIASGVSLLSALEITGEVVQNPYYQKVIASAGKEVQKGSPLSLVFQKEEKLYPILVGEMIEVGEETGQLSQMLDRGATFYEEEVDTITKNLSTIIEPVLMIVIGAAVGFFALAMIQPIYSIGDLI